MIKFTTHRVIQLNELSYGAMCKANQLLRCRDNAGKIGNTKAGSYFAARAMRMERIHAKASALLERFA